MLNSFYIPEPPVEPPYEPLPICPICWEESDTLYIDKFGAIVGCGNCINAKPAWEIEPEGGVT